MVLMKRPIKDSLTVAGGREPDVCPISAHIKALFPPGREGL